MEDTEEGAFFKQGADLLSEMVLASIFSTYLNTLGPRKHKYLLNPLCLWHFFMLAPADECILQQDHYVELSLAFSLIHRKKKCLRYNIYVLLI